MDRALLTPRCLLLSLLALVSLAIALPPLVQARAEPANDRRPSVADICSTLAQAAAENGLPEEFFTRLIWQESRFNPSAVSPAGAQGIAQFMPGTAAMRGLTNAFEPLQALRESASYLRELRTTFRGNLGLAAAAYNAGPGQVEAWRAGRSVLPGETQAYVRIVTGYSAEAWTAQPMPQLQSAATQTGERCVELARNMIDTPRRRPLLTVGPGLGTMGRPACRQLVRRTRACPLRAAAAQVRTRARRPAAAGPEFAPQRSAHLRRAGLGKDPGGGRRTLREAEGQGGRLRRLPQPAGLTRSSRVGRGGEELVDQAAW